MTLDCLSTYISATSAARALTGGLNKAGAGGRTCLRRPQRAADLSRAKLLSSSSIAALQHSAQRQAGPGCRALPLTAPEAAIELLWLAVDIASVSFSSQLLAVPERRSRREAPRQSVAIATGRQRRLLFHCISRLISLEGGEYPAGTLHACSAIAPELNFK